MTQEELAKRIARNDRLLRNQDFRDLLEVLARKSGFMVPQVKLNSEYDSGYRQALHNLIADIVSHSETGYLFVNELIKKHISSATRRADYNREGDR